MLINNKTESRNLKPTSHNLYSGYSTTYHNILGKGIGEKLRLNPDLTPLNTGKVLIGSAYQPKPCHMAEDQLWIQNALLDKYRQKFAPIPMTLADKVIACLGVLAVVVVWLTR